MDWLVLWGFWMASLVLAFLWGRLYERSRPAPPSGPSGNGGEVVRKAAVL